MSVFRKTIVRRFVLLILLSWGLLTHVATVYACESSDGSLYMSCCCESTDKSERKQKNCSDAGEDTIHNNSGSTSGSCCELSYGVTDASPASSNNNSLSSQMVSLVDAAQPPPLLSFFKSNITVTQHTQTFIDVIPPLTVGTLTYLRTQRLRI